MPVPGRHRSPPRSRHSSLGRHTGRRAAPRASTRRARLAGHCDGARGTSGSRCRDFEQMVDSRRWDGGVARDRPPGRRIVVKRQPSQGTTRGRGVRGGRLRDPPSRIGLRRGESFEGRRRRDWIRQHVAQRDGVGGIGIDRTHRKDAPPAQHRHGCSIRDPRRVDRVGVTPGRHRGADLRRRRAGRGREVTGRGFRRHEHRGLLITWALDRQKQRIDLMTSSRRRQDVYANELGRDPRPHPLHHRGPVGKA